MQVATTYDANAAKAYLDELWEREILPSLSAYIEIPNRSPLFDPAWAEHGHMERAVGHIASWIEARLLPGASLSIERIAGRTPLIVVDVPGNAPGRVLLYGHLDKQPEMTGWREPLGPWKPVREGDRLYGRGGADDGYAAYASMAALAAAQRFGGARPHATILIEASEESGSPDLPAHLDALGDRLGAPDLVVCLDSGCGTYDRLWTTTSLRGLVVGTLEVGILAEGVHSGDAGGVVPSTFRIARQLLSRLEDEHTGIVRPADLHVAIPAQRVDEAQQAGDILGQATAERFPFLHGARAPDRPPGERILDRTWRPSLEVVGAAGLPDVSEAGNVLRPSTTLKLSLRIPPTLSSAAATAFVKRCLEEDPPHGARVVFTPRGPGDGWEAPATAPWLAEAIQFASRKAFGHEAAWMGEGGTIPFMSMLGRRFPRAQFLITGVLGPGANAHGPNEFLHIPCAKAIAQSVALVLDRMGRQERR